MSNADFAGGLVYCGSAAWDFIGRKPGPDNKDEIEKLQFPAPNIYGPAAYIDVKSVHTHCTASHNVIIDGKYYVNYRSG
jgi:hypothetical protein